MPDKARRAVVKMDSSFVYLEIDGNEIQLRPLEARKLGESLFQTACSVDAKNPPIKKDKE